MKTRQQWISVTVVLLFGIVLFLIGTDGFRAFTAETARTNQLIKDEPLLPEVMLEDSKERTYTFSEFDGKYVMMTFIYTACSTVCPQLEVNLAEVYDAMPQQVVGEDIVFLSISFDPERDTPEVLDKYRTYFGSDGDTWRMARIPDATELQTLLDDFGVVVIPDGEGDFAHNVAFYLVGKDGRLMDVMDFTDIEGAQTKVLNLLDVKMEG